MPEQHTCTLHLKKALECGKWCCCVPWAIQTLINGGGGGGGGGVRACVCVRVNGCMISQPSQCILHGQAA
eukprot:1158471-Pelagomonas_calceolata.AAC.11